MTLRDLLSSENISSMNSLSGDENIENSISELTTKEENSGTSIRRISQIFPVYPEPVQLHAKSVSSISVHVPLCLQGLG